MVFAYLLITKADRALSNYADVTFLNGSTIAQFEANMNKIRSFFITAAFSAAALSAHAAVLQINAGGFLTGARGVSVGGTLYDVEFVDGSCAGVFGACDTAHFTFADETTALSAAQSLLDEVFIDQFDSNPALTSGCPGSPFCYVQTPYRIVDINRVGNAAAFNEIENASDSVGVSNLNIGADTSQSAGSTYAVWTVSSTVPEPSVLALLGIGLAGLAVTRRRKK